MNFKRKQEANQIYFNSFWQMITPTGPDSEGSSPDMDFMYSDTDIYDKILEIYSYTKRSEFQLNVKAF